MPTYTGTAREQWALAGLDVALGRLTAEELHALGEQLLRVRRDEIERVRDKIERLKRSRDAADERASVAEDDTQVAERKVGKLTLENDALRKRIADLEAKRP